MFSESMNENAGSITTSRFASRRIALIFVLINNDLKKFLDGRLGEYLFFMEVFSMSKHEYVIKNEYRPVLSLSGDVDKEDVIIQINYR